ncbi:uncharacterized protein PAC_15296 [Phialocephala subalpina]|uniref:Uncharacterized protein n=1 Tax=Phialocephala subalpina TaxID=576137 RepID=A0A1L7XKD6_9HELO|nr:uncharacterized protein PAC_15296 [Phialocephala subalpina]
MDDWSTQSRQMGSIYAHASLTIAAARAAHVRMGCFSPREIVKVGRIVGDDGEKCNIYARIRPQKHFVDSATEGLSRDLVYKGARPKIYTAPTWSWASQRGPVIWDYPLKKIKSKYEPVVKILRVYTTKSQPHFRFGGVSDGSLELEGVLIPATVVREEELGLTVQGHTYYERGFRLDVQVDPSAQYPREVFCVPLINVGLLSHFNFSIEKEWFESQPRTRFEIV